MQLLYPSFYPDFHCIAGACPDSCCRQGWQIVVDAAHLERWEALPAPLGDAVRMASETPARIMGIFDRKGSLEVGKDADIVMLDKDLNITGVWSMGRRVK